jgi:glycosyltransferase involved in cell wall biosynthesis
MNIAIVNEFFPPFITGGTEIFLNELAKYLKSKGHKIVVITTDQGQKENKEFKLYKVRPSPFHISHRYQFHGITIPCMFFNTKLTKHIEEIYEREEVGLVYLNNFFHLSFAPIKAAENKNLPIIFDIHDYWPICFTKDMFFNNSICTNQNILKCSYCVAGKSGCRFVTPFFIPGLLMERRLKQRALKSKNMKKIICHSKEGVSELKKHNLESISVDYPYLGPIKKHKYSKDNKFRILFVGRLEKIKGADLLVDVAKNLKSKIDFRVDVIGDGPLKQDLDRKDLNIHVHGFMKEERFRYFERADCLLALHVSSTPFGIIVLEGMAFQIPVIALKDSGPSFLVKENNAGLVCEKEELWQTIKKLHDDEMLIERIRKGNHEKIKRYSKENIFSQYEHIFKKYKNTK